jgi:hypothetical protein
MRRICLAFVLTLQSLNAADELVKPDKITIHTWVREDIFAGWIANDMDAFERGVRKLDRYLADYPNDQDALAWKYLVASKYMILARAKGDDAEYARYLAAAKAIRAQIFSGGRDLVGAYIILSNSLLNTATAAPEADRQWMLEDARDMLVKIPKLQGATFDKMPAHMRGEAWGELAFVSEKLGNSAARNEALDKMIAQLPGTPYATRALAWQTDGKLANEKQYTCLSCHDPGRLEPTLARLSTAK